MKIFSNIRLLLLVLWLGAAVFFSFAVAPGAFAVLPTREMAGLMVQRSLMIVNISGLSIGLFLLITSFFNAKSANLSLVWVERILLFILTAACAVGQFAIALWLSFVRTEIGRPIDELALDDPLRIKFNNIHEYSVWIMITAMAAALLVYFVMAGKNSSTPAKESRALDFQNEFKI